MATKRRRWRVVSVMLLGILLVLVTLSVFVARGKAQALAEADLGDGRILQIEAVTFGTTHATGVASPFLDRFGSWMPHALREFLRPVVPKSSITCDEPCLVVWVNAVNSTFRTNVDCQGIRLEFVDGGGTVYGEHQANWFGAEKFWRVGHVFEAFPRGSRELKLKVTPWRGSNSVHFTLANPGYTKAEAWTGKALPQRERQGEYELVLESLIPETDKGTYWKAETVFWKPGFQMWRNGNRDESGWDIEWNSEDAFGNRGKHLGISQPVLKFLATAYPSGTNTHAAVLITNLPIVETGIKSNVWWNIGADVTTNKVVVLGVFPAGVHTFSEGEYLTNPPVTMGAVQGGAPSGWVSQSQRTPMRTIRFYGHYTDAPVIYVKASNPESKQRIAMRLLDQDSKMYLIAEPEPQGNPDGVIPFIVRVSPEVKKVQAELVLLPSLKAEFLVDTTLSRNAANR